MLMVSVTGARHERISFWRALGLAPWVRGETPCVVPGVVIRCCYPVQLDPPLVAAMVTPPPVQVLVPVPVVVWVAVADAPAPSA